ncbi:hypothetical protein Vdis_0544 [Vulcanisaeta distributa DSM 14429]|uniref:Uncharacterized protein n=1 Tax=Vulcanisaeta distributa (strain DSM 14429 / JCM 11212 / NBRC 100878 / IC-017) TaxID=572478 RepID=E1QUT9_VULDI|nr:hypothetical protein Vdis_0544 [Vulcanisaeta distributa DSM 14429]
MDPYLIGAFMNECSVMWRSVEGFSDAVDYVRSLEPGITMSNNILNATSSLCDEVNKILQKPTRLLMFFNINDWIRLLRGLYDFYGELIDPEPSLDIPNFVLSIRIPNKSLGLALRIALKFLGINSNVFPGNDGKLYLVIHERESIARFIKTVKPHLDPELNIALRNKWIKHYIGSGEPLVIIKE